MGKEESSSLYPNDMKIRVGNVVLFKVERDTVLGEFEQNCFRVLAMKIESHVIDYFFERFYPFTLTKSPSLEQTVLRGVGQGFIKDCVEGAEVGHHPKELLLLSNEVVTTRHDSKVEKGEFSLIGKDVVEMEVTLKDETGVKEAEKTCLAVKNAKRKLCFFDDDVGFSVGRKNKFIKFM